jgi:WD40 repeat protein
MLHPRNFIYIQCEDSHLHFNNRNVDEKKDGLKLNSWLTHQMSSTRRSRLKGIKLDHTIKNGAPVRNICVTQRYMIANGNYSLRIYGVKNKQLVKNIPGDIDVPLYVSSDERIVISDSTYMTKVMVWDIEQGQLKRSIHDPDFVQGVCLTKDNKFMVSCSSDRSVKVWQIGPDGKFTLLHTLKGHTHVVNCICLTSDDKFVISAGRDKTIKVWDLHSGELVNSWRAHSKKIYSLAMSQKNDFVISGSADKTIKVWKFPDGHHISTMTGHTDGVSSLCVNQNDSFMVSGSIDNTVRIWDFQRFELIKTLEGHTKEVSSVYVTENEEIVSGSFDGTIKIWK